MGKLNKEEQAIKVLIDVGLNGKVVATKTLSDILYKHIFHFNNTAEEFKNYNGIISDKEIKEHAEYIRCLTSIVTNICVNPLLTKKSSVRKDSEYNEILKDVKSGLFGSIAFIGLCALHQFPAGLISSLMNGENNPYKIGEGMDSDTYGYLEEVQIPLPIATPELAVVLNDLVTRDSTVVDNLRKHYVSVFYKKDDDVVILSEDELNDLKKEPYDDNLATFVEKRLIENIIRGKITVYAVVMFSDEDGASFPLLLNTDYPVLNADKVKVTFTKEYCDRWDKVFVDKFSDNMAESLITLQSEKDRFVTDLAKLNAYYKFS